MKKSSLTTAVVAGLAGAAGLVNVSNAVNVNPDGLGQVLIYPYYTVNADNATLISVVNTTNDVKAVKVRFLEGRNSQEVLDFNLYLSPFDVWTGAVHDLGDSNGPAVMTTDDRSCTVPYFWQERQDAGGNAGINQGNYSGFFKNFEYALNNDDGGPYGLDRTREGHLEMIEMGRVVDDGDDLASAGVSVEAVDPTLGDTGGELAWAALHVAGVPNDCQALVDAFRVVEGVAGQWEPNFGDVSTDIDEPNGGLFGGAEIANALQGTNLSYNADALEGFYQLSNEVTGLVQNLHTNPGSVSPSLEDAEDLNGTGVAQAIVFDNGTLVTLDFDRGLDAVSAAFMHNQVYNEYVTSPGAGASSEWVMTFPTKRLHIEDTLTWQERRPFTVDYDGHPSTPAGACEPVELAFWDREEQFPGALEGSTGVCPSPLPPEGCNPTTNVPGPRLCWEATVLTFNQAQDIIDNEESNILGARYATNFELVDTYLPSGLPSPTATTFHTGWIRLDFYTDGIDNSTGGLGSDGVNDHSMLSLPEAGGGLNLVEGLPVTGFWAAEYVNGELSEGVVANYSGLHKHRADRNGYGVDTDGVTPTGFAWS
ncbi:MAG: hypothetical protein R3F22_09860 [Lysobacteraceae bacterium]